jgi:hypothetical protein
VKTASPKVTSPEVLLKRMVAGAFVCQFILLVIAGWQNRHNLNTDAIAYLRIAGYYASGQMELMVSGYWGPMLSWIIAVFIKLGCDPLIAARCAMGLSAILFLYGCRALLRGFELPVAAQVTGVWVAALASVFWSVRNITPDLLMGGWMALALAALVHSTTLAMSRNAVNAGIFWGLAYLAKAAAFPLAILIVVGVALLQGYTRVAAAGKIARHAAITLAVFAVVSAPWVIVLSAKYQGFTFSTSGRINHAIAGPPGVERYHPTFRTLHPPEAGRVTSWEDPSRLPYAYWSPLADGDSLQHQLRLIAQNGAAIARLLSGMRLLEMTRLGDGFDPRDVMKILPGVDLFHLGLLGLAGCLIHRGNWRAALARDRWRWALLPVACLGAIYLPVFLLPDDQRYFYPALPLLWAAACGTLQWLAEQFGPPGGWLRKIVLRVAVASFGLPALFWLLVALVGLPNPATDCALIAAGKLRAAKFSGPIAGSALLSGGRAGLYTAYFHNVPWLGDIGRTEPAGLKSCGAQIIITQRGSSLAQALQADPSFRDLDAELFSSSESVAGFPLKLFALTNR